nr:hypothetical protein [uncultured Undibacterium sp.]
MMLGHVTKNKEQTGEARDDVSYQRRVSTPNVNAMSSAIAAHNHRQATVDGSNQAKQLRARNSVPYNSLRVIQFTTMHNMMNRAAVQRMENSSEIDEPLQAKSSSEVCTQLVGSRVAQFEVTSSDSGPALATIIEQLEELAEDDQEEGQFDTDVDLKTDLALLREKIGMIRSVASTDDEAQKNEALNVLRPALANVKQDSGVSAQAPIVAETSASGVVQAYSQQVVQREVTRGQAIVAGLIGIGTLLGTIAIARARRRALIYAEFGGGAAKGNIDPDVVVAHGNPRPDDAPQDVAYTHAFNRLHSAKLYFEKHHPALAAQYRTAAARTITAEMLDIASVVKHHAVDHKARVKNLTTDTSIQDLRIQFTADMLIQTQRAQALTNAIMERINAQRWIGTVSEDDVHQSGTSIWRGKWTDIVMAVNTVLHTKWPEWKARIGAWINARRDALHPYMIAPGNMVLDYIGSLARGTKGPPKQSVRFTPEKFDVDANLTAAPLAAYAIHEGGAVIDRGKVKEDNVVWNGILTPMQDAMQAGLVDAGLLEMGMAADEPFEVVLDTDGLQAGHGVAASTELAKSTREVNLRAQIYQIRTDNIDRWSLVRAAINLNADLLDQAGTGLLSRVLTAAEMDRLDLILQANP